MAHLHLRSGHAPYSSGPDNPKLVAWSQCAVNLPIPVRVTAGEQIGLWASRTMEDICVGIRDVGDGAATRSGAGEVVAFSQTEDERWTAELRDSAFAAMRPCYATAPFAPVHAFARDASSDAE